MLVTVLSSMLYSTLPKRAEKSVQRAGSREASEHKLDLIVADRSNPKPVQVATQNLNLPPSSAYYQTPASLPPTYKVSPILSSSSSSASSSSSSSSASFESPSSAIRQSSEAISNAATVVLDNGNRDSLLVEILSYIPTPHSYKLVNKQFKIAVEALIPIRAKDYVEKIINCINKSKNPEIFADKIGQIKQSLEKYKNIIFILDEETRYKFINKEIYKILKLDSYDRTIPKSLSKFKAIALIFVEIYGNQLEFVSKKLRDNEEVVLTAVKSHSIDVDDIIPFKYASKRLKAKRDFVIKVLAECGEAIDSIPKAMRDRELVEIALNNDPTAIEWVPKKFRNDEQIAYSVVSRVGGTYIYLSERLRNKHDLFMLALNVSKNNRDDENWSVSPHIFKAAPAEFMNNGQIFFDYFYYADKYETLNDKIRRNSLLFSPFPYLGPNLVNNKAYALSVVSRFGYALEYFSDELRNDRDVVLAAIAKDAGAIQFAGPGFVEDPEIIAEKLGKKLVSINLRTLRQTNR